MSLLPIMMWLNIRFLLIGIAQPRRFRVIRGTQLQAGSSMTGDSRQMRKISPRPSSRGALRREPPLLDDAFLGQPLDLAPAAAEQFGQHVHIVFAIARRAAIDRSADI